jgi:hypothetical protein
MEGIKKLQKLLSCFSSCHQLSIKSNNSGTAKVKIVKIERDPSLFTGKLLIKFQNILRNATQDIIRGLKMAAELMAA